MIRLTLLGAAAVSDGLGNDLNADGQQPKRIALLGYLALARPRGAHRRDTIVALLWPGLDQDRARSALRQALHGLRRALGHDVIRSKGMNALALDPAFVRCDAWELEEATTRGDHQHALRIYTGDALAGLFVGASPEFEQWLDAERSRLRELAVASAWALADQAAQSQCADDVARWARRAIVLAPFDESAVRRSMRLLAGAGDRAGAMAIYEQFALDAAKELEVDPSPETQSLARDVRAGSRPAPATSGTIASLPLPEPRPVSPSPHAAPLGIPVRPARRGVLRRVTTGILAATAILGATSRVASSPLAERDPRRILVLGFEAEGRTDLSAIARRASSEARSALGRIVSVEVLAAQSDAPGRAGTIVRGEVRAAGDSVQLRAEVVDASRGVILRTLESRWVPRAAPDDAVASLQDRLTAAVATTLFPGWSTAISQPLSFAAYRYFVEGMSLIKAERHPDAAAAFQRAYAADSAFTAAAVLTGMEYLQIGRYDSADSIARTLRARGDDLPAVDRRLLDWLSSSLAGDRLAALAAMRDVTVRAPGAELAWLQLAVDAVETARPREALDALDRIDPGADFGEGWPAYWATRIEALHILGDHQRELSVARAGMSRHPEMRLLAGYELRALAALGRSNDVLRRVEALAALPADAQQNAPMLMRQAALELRAHGDAASARTVLARARSWYDAQPVSARGTVAFQAGLARTAYLADDRDRARTIYDSLAATLGRCADCAGVLGVLAARDGDRVRAEQYSATLARDDRRWMFGRPTLWRARIAATLGDSAAAIALLSAAFAAGSEFDVLTHADIDLASIRPEMVYREWAWVDKR